LGVNAVEKDESTLSELAKRFEATLAEQRQAHDSVMAEIKKSLEMATQASEAATESAKKVGVTVHMTAFATAAAGHRRAAFIWAIATCCIAIGLLVGAVYSIVCGDGPPVRDGSWYLAANLSHYLARALAVSLGSFLLVFCTRNFRSAKHNEVVNSHRAGALATHDTLRVGAGNRVDEVVSLHVAEAVFTSQPSGYAESDDHGTHLTELLAALKNLRS
jgi:D-serine deaminase-like pyridoxal phosphate-dependent protein